ncbi:hypothetical protein DPMN_153704 [Dreissena polymorpha]|uniref:Uncharacterized protein n=1 Tax=Dreissena polymorpha TaxID=45954 RepID=A0A9D4FJ32_DREPO|nr:hypothetical protein DPMN_153704 [Dreissena polymorpha]
MRADAHRFAHEILPLSVIDIAFRDYNRYIGRHLSYAMPKELMEYIKWTSSKQEAMTNNIDGPGRVNYFLSTRNVPMISTLNLKKMEISTVQLTHNQQILRFAEFEDINGSRSRLGIDHLVAESPRLFAETRRGTPRHDAEEIGVVRAQLKLMEPHISQTREVSYENDDYDDDNDENDDDDDHDDAAAPATAADDDAVAADADAAAAAANDDDDADYVQYHESI